jgi:hypothetical protein
MKKQTTTELKDKRRIRKKKEKKKGRRKRGDLEAVDGVGHFALALEAVEPRARLGSDGSQRHAEALHL